MRVILAPDKFKGSVSAPEAARFLAEGLRSVDPGLDIVLMPVADGGDGTIDAVTASGFTRVVERVQGPTGESVQADFAVRGTVAVIEMAAASGLAVLHNGTPSPLLASTYGTGQLVKAALDRGCTEIVLGVGGSATTDGGAGMLAALGATFKDSAGRHLPPGGGALATVTNIELGGLDRRLGGVQFTLASDVDNPLLGPDGAAAVFAPQKGASEAHVAHLETALERYFRVMANALGTAAVDAIDAPGSGAAGGTGYAALAVLSAKRRPGIDVVLELTGLADKIGTADLVITGEGSLDEQSLFGKAPMGVATAARAAGIPVVAVCGRTTLTPEVLHGAGFAHCYALTDLNADTEHCMKNAGALLTQIGATIGARLATRGKEEENSYV
ncbi:glycerate kinase [Arthrobacter sp. lap29]|uniref:glycerate kinase n=1 Tax=Arthrobacter sp. lap29 TaxID=3056122 RepID=UPI0028F74DFA|nr:glycerate kinase [Arthrobacter sp. lap29]